MEVQVRVNITPSMVFVAISPPAEEEHQAAIDLQKVEFGPTLRTGQLLEAGHPLALPLSALIQF